ncbi:fibrobacter succinogenes major paralogous domain-containing protein [Cognatilysobacter tabacisoli]|uniref:fibrobacter succinogenes major paralogous domain-containing protein n=1 Tax=Cognatilysobacter tabacisoli TaxID=2315424 RepID=UPI000E6B1788|nr:fibrobacter succinogenes major paralogous domain-containing protein [Lysobacter tabacisoli]
MGSAAAAEATARGEAATDAVASVTIGAQVWMARNLEVTTFRNGDPIAVAVGNAAWAAAARDRMPALTSYGDDPTYRERFGLLYNHHAVVDPRGLCPPGWRIPDNHDWDALEAHLGRSGAATALKSAVGWPGSGNGSNASGFDARPGGFRIQDGTSRLGGRVGYWWSLSTDATDQVTSILLFDYDGRIFRIQYPRGLGQSVRCLR